MIGDELFALRICGASCTRTDNGVQIVIPGIGILDLSSIDDDDRLCVVATEYIVDGEADGLRDARRRELARITRALVRGDVAHVVDPHGIMGSKRGAAA